MNDESFSHHVEVANASGTNRLKLEGKAHADMRHLEREKTSETLHPSPDQMSTDVSAAHGFRGPIKVMLPSPMSRKYKTLRVVKVSHSINSGKPRNYPLRGAIQKGYDSFGLSRILDHN